MSVNFIKEYGYDAILYQPTASHENQWPSLQPGVYKPWVQLRGFDSVQMFTPTVQKDNLIEFTEGVFRDVDKMINDFLSVETAVKYKAMGIAHKMGILLYGPPGTGKTSLAALIMMSSVQNHNAICIDCTGQKIDYIRSYMKTIKTHSPDNPVIVFVDEFDSSIKYEEEKYLPFLDGSDSYDKMLFIGCTNNYNDLPDRIAKRKSRIRKAFEVRSLPRKVYYDYVMSKLPELDVSLAKEIAYKCENEGLTIDQTKHVLIEFFIENKTIDESIAAAKIYSQEDSKKD